MNSAVARGVCPRIPALILLATSISARAAEPDCTEVLSRNSLIACGLNNSPVLAAELATVHASTARREAARPFLPSNPTVGATLGSRVSADARATNWSVTLAQELEVAGQSFLRVEVADDELKAANAQVSVVRAELSEQLWLAWFETVAARERIKTASLLEQATSDVARTAKGMAANGLASTVDSTAADAAWVAASERRLEAQRASRGALLRLQSLIGARIEMRADATLEPLRTTGKGDTRPELKALEALKSASTRRIALLRRSRAPNPTITLFAQNDGFNERVLGIGVGLPIPLPQPVGRTKAGEIEEALAQEERLQAEIDGMLRRLATERAVAESDTLAVTEKRTLFSAERLAAATAALQALSTQLSAGRLTVREALVTQQSLVELLQSELAMREAACVASVRAARANGLSLEGEL
ncbi:MAG: TolC family protein [Archangium sp.]|nr:TolC family protein [Archangium sp.]